MHLRPAHLAAAKVHAPRPQRREAEAAFLLQHSENPAFLARTTTWCAAAESTEDKPRVPAHRNHVKSSCVERAEKHAALNERLLREGRTTRPASAALPGPDHGPGTPRPPAAPQPPLPAGGLQLLPTSDPGAGRVGPAGPTVRTQAGLTGEDGKRVRGEGGVRVGGSGRRNEGPWGGGV